ncbi:MAG: serine/threonine-protein kinase, partial [Acidimicrobiales bacterium]
MSDHPAPPRFEAPPPAIPGLELLEPIGRGGFSTVWRARQAMIDRIVAVKLLSLDMRDPADQRRFQRECSAAGRLTSHPHVVQVYEVGFVDARPYLVMEHFAGGSAADLLARRGPLPLAEALDVGAKIAGALHAAHTLGILHRDVKPENILLDGAGRPALADFGISTVGFNQSLSSIKDTFTPLHAAPETVEGRAPSPAADVYALASTVWTLLAGFAPFQRSDDSSVAAILLRILHEPPPPLPVPAPPALGALLDRSLAKRPEDRPASAAELGAALAEIA